MRNILRVSERVLTRSLLHYEIKRNILQASERVLAHLLVTPPLLLIHHIVKEKYYK